MGSNLFKGIFAVWVLIVTYAVCAPYLLPNKVNAATFNMTNKLKMGQCVGVNGDESKLETLYDNNGIGYIHVQTSDLNCQDGYFLSLIKLRLDRTENTTDDDTLRLHGVCCQMVLDNPSF